MTRPVVSPDELHSLDFADPRTHAERELTEAWRHPRAERPCHRQSPRADRLGCRVLSHYADAMAVYRDKEHVTTERGNALENLVTGGHPATRSLLSVTAGPRRTRPRNVPDAAVAPKALARIRHSPHRGIGGFLAVAPDKSECSDEAAALPEPTRQAKSGLPPHSSDAAATRRGTDVLHGRPVKGGDIATVWTSSADRGAEPFPDPDRLTPDDRPDPHPTSGFGAHMPTAEQTGPEQRTHPGVRYGMSTLPVARTPEGR